MSCPSVGGSGCAASDIGRLRNKKNCLKGLFLLPGCSCCCWLGPLLSLSLSPALSRASDDDTGGTGRGESVGRSASLSLSRGPPSRLRWSATARLRQRRRRLRKHARDKAEKLIGDLCVREGEGQGGRRRRRCSPNSRGLPLLSGDSQPAVSICNERNGARKNGQVVKKWSSASSALCPSQQKKPRKAECFMSRGSRSRSLLADAATR